MLAIDNYSTELIDKEAARLWAELSSDPTDRLKREVPFHLHTIHSYPYPKVGHSNLESLLVRLNLQSLDLSLPN